MFDGFTRAVSVSDALSDLPALKPGEDGSQKGYVSPPKHPYQQFMRGIISPVEYVRSLAAMEPHR
jgi:hypothetical protein